MPLVEPLVGELRESRTLNDRVVTHRVKGHRESIGIFHSVAFRPARRVQAECNRIRRLTKPQRVLDVKDDVGIPKLVGHILVVIARTRDPGTVCTAALPYRHRNLHQFTNIVCVHRLCQVVNRKVPISRVVLVQNTIAINVIEALFLTICGRTARDGVRFRAPARHNATNLSPDSAWYALTDTPRSPHAISSPRPVSAFASPTYQ